MWTWHDLIHSHFQYAGESNVHTPEARLQTREKDLIDRHLAGHPKESDRGEGSQSDFHSIDLDTDFRRISYFQSLALAKTPGNKPGNPPDHISPMGSVIHM